jgi:ferritin
MLRVTEPRSETRVTGRVGKAERIISPKRNESKAASAVGYVHDRGGTIKLHAIDQPPSEWKSSLELFQQVLEHEQKVTGMIHRLYELAVKENDYATQITLQWFITEQVEEEKNAGEIIEQLG